MLDPPFTIDTNLKTTPSPLSAPFLDNYFASRGTGFLAGTGPSIIATATTLSINASYIAAHAALESAWGSAPIARLKNNIFGWSAFDESPFASARAFPSLAACILFVMSRIHVLYLTPGGRYFCLAPCLGKGGPDKYGMNANYASDPDWGAKIAHIVQQLEFAFSRCP